MDIMDDEPSDEVERLRTSKLEESFANLQTSTQKTAINTVNKRAILKPSNGKFSSLGVRSSSYSL